MTNNIKQYMQEDKDFYIRIETDDDIEYHIFSDYEGAVDYCKIKNINIINIRKYCGYKFLNE
jgi:hypothetical protein